MYKNFNIRHLKVRHYFNFLGMISILTDRQNKKKINHFVFVQMN